MSDDLVKRLRGETEPGFGNFDCHSVWGQMLNEAADRIEDLEAENARLRAALESIDQWSKAYPETVFPEPDFKLVAEALKRAGLSLDAVSASNIRHVIKGVGKIARAALNGGKE